MEFDIYDDRQSRKPIIRPFVAASGALVCAVTGLACHLAGVHAVALVLGAVGLFLGGNSFGHGIKALSGNQDRKPLILSSAGLFLSAIVFMFAFAKTIWRHRIGTVPQDIAGILSGTGKGPDLVYWMHTSCCNNGFPHTMSMLTSTAR